ncbi:MAG: hypothetical protein AAFW01_17720 [Pseudomonadota bacterium]
MDLGTDTLTTVQTVTDLLAVAAARNVPLPAPVIPVGSDGRAHFKTAEIADILAPIADRASLRTSLAGSMAAAEKDAERAIAATALMLAHCIATRDGSHDWLSTWASMAPIARAAPPPVRAALMNGFRTARTLGVADESVCPSDEDCITKQAPAIAERLIPLARAMTPNERRAVARADYGKDFARHLAALHAVLFRPGCLMTSKEYWYPSEVVELVAHVPDEEGFVPATALLLIQVLADKNAECHAEFRWNNNSRAYLAMPDRWRLPILDAFRHCYEAFGSFDELGADGHCHLDKILPWDPSSS